MERILRDSCVAGLIAYAGNWKRDHRPRVTVSGGAKDVDSSDRRRILHRVQQETLLAATDVGGKAIGVSKTKLDGR